MTFVVEPDLLESLVMPVRFSRLDLLVDLMVSVHFDFSDGEMHLQQREERVACFGFHMNSLDRQLHAVLTLK